MHAFPRVWGSARRGGGCGGEEDDRATERDNEEEIKGQDETREIDGSRTSIACWPPS